MIKLGFLTQAILEPFLSAGQGRHRSLKEQQETHKIHFTILLHGQKKVFKTRISIRNLRKRPSFSFIDSKSAKYPNLIQFQEKCFNLVSQIHAIFYNRKPIRSQNRIPSFKVLNKESISNTFTQWFLICNNRARELAKKIVTLPRAIAFN